MLQRGHSSDVCDRASTLCKYDLRKGDLFVLSWARVRRVRQGIMFSHILDRKREDQTPPIARVKGVGRQQSTTLT